MLNMQSVATSLRVGKRAGYLFSAGLAVVLAIQAGTTIFFANFLSKHAEILEAMKNWALPLFLILAGVFIIKGIQALAERRAEVAAPYKGGPFWRGAGMAAMNLLNIPVFFALGSWLVSAGFLRAGFLPKFSYTLGVGVGAIGVFSLYAHLAGWFSRHAAMFTRNINFVIGGFFLILALVQWLRLAG